MEAIRILIIVAIGALVTGYIGLTVIYPLIKTIGSGAKVTYRLAMGVMPEVGVTLADGGEKTGKDE